MAEKQFDLAALANAPLANALEKYSPDKKRKIRNGPRAQVSDDFCPKLSQKQLADIRSKTYHDRLSEVLDHYAKTDVPFERIAQHVNMPIEKVASCMKFRGRLA